MEFTTDVARKKRLLMVRKADSYWVPLEDVEAVNN
jgi:hypothetical protein